MIVDAICDPGPRGVAARSALGGQPPDEPLTAPGYLAFEIMSALRAAANRPDHPFKAADLSQALHDAEPYEIDIEGTPWVDVHRAWALSEQSLRYVDAISWSVSIDQRPDFLNSSGPRPAVLFDDALSGPRRAVPATRSGP